MSGYTVPPSLVKFMAVRDNRLAKNTPWDKAQITDKFNELLSKGSVNFGGRSCAGAGNTDPTWTALLAWFQTIAKARSMGFKIHEIPLKFKHKSPSTSGGYWQESEYQLLGGPHG